MKRTKNPVKNETYEVLDTYVEEHLDNPPFGFPGLVVPAEVLLHPNLNSDEKLLFALLENLTSNQYGCTEASNGDLGYDLGIKKHKISNALSNLQRKGFIKLEYSNGRQCEDTSSFPCTERKIFIDKTYHMKYSRGGA
jgi:hypothetical protein